MNRCKRYEEQLPLMVYGELEEDAQRGLQEHLRVCSGCRQQLEDLRVVLQLADRVPRYEPSEALLARSRARLQLRLRQSRRQPIMEWLAAARAYLAGLRVFVPQFAVALSILFAGVLAGHYLWPAEEPAAVIAPAVTTSEQAVLPRSDDTEIASIRYSPESGLVEIRYLSWAPVTLRGRPEEAGIREALAAALRQNDPSLRLRAASVLSAQPSADEDVVDALLQALRSDSNLGVRLRVVKALQQMPFLPRVRDALIWTLLNDENESVRMEAIETLSKSRSEPGFDLAPIFQKTAREDTNRAVRTRAEKAIRRLDNSERAVRP